QGEPDVVETFEQTALAEGIDLKSDNAAVGTTDLLLFKIDGDGGVGAAIGIVHQFFQVFGRNLDRQDAVLKAVVVKDVGKGGRDHTANAEIEQRPGGVLARGAATEVFASHQHFGVAIGWFVQHEVGA